ncbi:Transmembrane CLPTM1 family protein [Raphanus sativus]|nr:Transmembrane CLPTM1 family protein [Raphanus sativus]
MIPINEKVSEVALNLEISPISMTKWQLFQQVDQSFQIHRSYGSMLDLDGESDELKISSSGEKTNLWKDCLQSLSYWTSSVRKAMRIEVDRSGMIPRLRFHDRESYASNKTKEFHHDVSSAIHQL